MMLNLFFVVLTVCTALQAVPLQSVPGWKSRLENRHVSVCSLCNQFVDDVYKALDYGVSNEQILDTIVDKCKTLKLHSEEVCRGTATIAAPVVRYIYSQSKLVPGNVCGILLQSENCTIAHPDKLEWTINTSSKPKPNIASQSSPSQSAAESSTIKVLHFADPHWDPEYLSGSNANCGDPLCCRASSGIASKAEDEAGYWGDYRSCDMPWRTIENAVAHMAQQHADVAYIIWTGDLVPHNNWSTDKEEILMINERLLNLMKSYFPNTPIYLTLGNHEAHPVNTFAPPEITDNELSTAWLYNDTAIQWAKWLPDDASTTVRYGGYYTTLVRPGLRIVSLNTNYCYTFNWWLLYESKDPASGLVWLNLVLEDAEKAGEKVHLISHIPPGSDDCWSIFSREFAKIINRFESTVVAQFYGHTHKEEFKVFYDSEDVDRPTNVAFIAGSLTSYVNLNPSYRVYTVDGPRPETTWGVLDFTTWVMNLTAANLEGAARDPVWLELYQAKKEYDLIDLSPSSINNLFHKMLDEKDLFLKYFRNYHKATDNVVNMGCDTECQFKVLCPVVTSNFADQNRCNSVKQHLSSFVRN